MDWIAAESALIQEELVQHRRWLHRHAEIGFDLPETFNYVDTQLQQMGIQANKCGRAGLVGIIGNPTVGRTVLLRADMDALPIPEESDVSFAAKNGNMHACGHDLHTAMLLGAAKLLKAHESELKGCVKLMFQPAEEIFAGAHDMILNNLLDHPAPDAAFMIHVSTGIPMPSGTIIICPPGVSAPAADSFTITIRGKGCHGSAPYKGIDALTAASHIFLGLQEIPSRELSPTENAVLTIGTFHGGSASNAIADTAVLSGTIRSYSEDTRKFLKSRIMSISESIAAAYRASANVDFGSGCPVLINNKELCVMIDVCLKQFFGADIVLNAADHKSTLQSGGSEDFAYISHRIPSAMLVLAAGNSSDGYLYPQHHPKVIFDESVLSRGTAAFLTCTFGYLAQNPETEPTSGTLYE